MACTIRFCPVVAAKVWTTHNVSTTGICYIPGALIISNVGVYGVVKIIVIDKVIEASGTQENTMIAIPTDSIT